MKKINLSKFLTPAFLCLFIQNVNAQNNVGINTTSPAASAALHIVDTTKGILIPRMTSTHKAAITSPATGLLIFQTDGTAGFYYYNGAAWVVLGGGAATTDASLLTSGTLADARLSSNVTLKGNTFNAANSLVNLNGSAQLPALSGVNLTDLNASNLASGTVPLARLGSSGTASATTFLRGDNTWATPAGGAPSGTAGGSLSGTYPNPTIASGVVGSTEITNATIVNADISSTAAIALSKLSTTGTASATTFLRGDGQWATPAGGGTTTILSERTTDLNVTSTSTYTSAVSLSLDAGKTYFIEAQLYGQRASAAVVNGSTSIRITYTGSATTQDGIEFNGTGYIIGTTFSSTSFTTDGSTNTATVAPRNGFRCVVTTTTAGTFAFEAAKGSSPTSTADYVVRKGSWIKATPVN